MEGLYSGDKLDGLRHGLGTLTFPNGDKVSMRRALTTAMNDYYERLIILL